MVGRSEGANAAPTAFLVDCSCMAAISRHLIAARSGQITICRALPANPGAGTTACQSSTDALDATLLSRHLACVRSAQRRAALPPSNAMMDGSTLRSKIVSNLIRFTWTDLSCR